MVLALSALGRPGVALDVLRARSGAARRGNAAADAPGEPDQAAALREAHAGLEIRLGCGLVSEAFMEVRAAQL